MNKKSAILSITTFWRHKMIRTEDEKLEREVLAGVSCIAIPIEIFSPLNGEPEITVYSFCTNDAEEWFSRFSDDLLSEEAVNYLKNRFSAIAEKIGYTYFESENELMNEFVFLPQMQVQKTEIGIKVHKISSNAVLSEICRASGCDIEIADDGEDIVFAVVENGILMAYAGMNDVVYPDGSVEISVETAPNARRKGYGYACVSALTSHLNEKGITVRYKCSADNTASFALAEKCGFLFEGRRFSFVCERS